MTNEAILRDVKPSVSRRYTCATSTAIPKGTFLSLTGDQTVSKSAVSTVFKGFAHADVNSSTDTAFNTETSVTVDKGGMYELMCSGAVVIGQYVKCAGDNYVMAATTLDIASMARVVMGIANETGSDDEVINVEVFA